MYKMIAIYKMPADVSAFSEWYKGHTEIAKKVPLVKEFRFSKITGGPRGASDLHFMAELVFASKEDFKTAMSSPENMAAGKDAFTNYKDIVSVHFAEEEILKA
ncbi:MAG: EthD family reductase [Bacteriovorax sp.]|nr:EthD family reductase [Bacteriovorax sp.]